MLCQFHDVLPGSGIGMIYEDAEERYRNVQAIGSRILEDSLKILHPGKGHLHVVDLLPNQERPSVIDAAPGDSTPTLSQLSADGKKRFYVHSKAGGESGHVQGKSLRIEL